LSVFTLLMKSCTFSSSPSMQRQLFVQFGMSFPLLSLFILFSNTLCVEQSGVQAPEYLVMK
jgi:succinate-acetate transporter protein